MQTTPDFSRTVDIDKLRAERDAKLTSITPISFMNSTADQIEAWRRSHVAAEVSRHPHVDALSRKILDALTFAVKEDRCVGIEHPDAEGGFVYFQPTKTVLDSRGFTFGDVTIELHRVDWHARNPSDPIVVWSDRGRIILHATPFEESCAMYDELSKTLDGWREAGEELLLDIDGETTTIDSNLLYAYGLSLSIAGDVMNLDDIACISSQHGPENYALGRDVRILTTYGRRIRIAPTSSLDLSTPEGIDVASRSINADFGTIYRDIATGIDLGREAVSLPGVKRIVVLADDLAPMERAYAEWNGRSPSPKYDTPVVTLLDWTPAGPVNMLDVTRATWSAYILSLKASEDLGLNERCHVSPPSLADSAKNHLAAVGAVPTPHDCVYGSGECYWELSELEFDASTGTLTITPSMGS